MMSTSNSEATMKASVYIATSLDGFIARTNGGLDWLPGGEGEGAGDEDYGYREFMDSVDYLVMGRNTYEVVLGFGGEWSYGEKPVVVLSSRPVDIPDYIADTVERMFGPPGDVARRLAERGASHLYVDGGRTIQGFLTAGLIQQLIITRVPVLIGDGIPLFGSLPHDIQLRHIETRSFASGLVQSRYEIAGDERRV
jgi:dihydrofolate reductase